MVIVFKLIEILRNDFAESLMRCMQFLIQISNRQLDNMNQRVMDAGITNEAILTLEIVNELAPKTASKKKASSKSGGASAHSEGEWDEEEDRTAVTDETNEVSEEDKQVCLNKNR